MQAMQAMIIPRVCKQGITSNYRQAKQAFIMQLMQLKLMQCPKSKAAKEVYPKKQGTETKSKTGPKQIQYEQNGKEKNFII